MKKVLLSFFVVGLLSCFTFASVFAVLNSETQTNRMTIASGTLTFGNTVNNSVKTCYTYGTGSSGNANTCDALFTNATLMYPGTPVVTAKVALTNNGSLDGSALSVYMPSCTMVTSPSAPAPGGMSPCASGGAQIYIQETDSNWNSTNCVYPAASGSCSFVGNTMSYLASSRNTVASAWPLGGGLAVGASRYFIVGMELPATASNALQGEEADFSLTWHLSQ